MSDQGGVLGNHPYEAMYGPTLSWAGGFPLGFGPPSTYPSPLYIPLYCLERDTPIDNKDQIHLFLCVYLLFASVIVPRVRLLRLRSRYTPLDRTRRQKLCNALSARAALPTDLHRAFVEQALVVHRRGMIQI